MRNIVPYPYFFNLLLIVMNKLQQQLIDYCLDNPKATSDQVQKDLVESLGIKSEENVKINLEAECLLDVFNITMEEANAYVNRINDVMDKEESTPKAYEIIHAEIPKHIFLLMLESSNKELVKAKRILKTLGINHV